MADAPQVNGTVPQNKAEEVATLHLKPNTEQAHYASTETAVEVIIAKQVQLAEQQPDVVLDTSVSTPHPDLKPRETWSGKVEFLLTCVAYAVGLGNVWRFPYLCYNNGGGAFLIPYLLMLAFLGLPLFYLELALGQYASLGPISILGRMCPLFKGLGYTMMTVSFMVSIYYNAILGISLFYFFASFTSELPWTHCHNWWNTPRCHESAGYLPANTSRSQPINSSSIVSSMPLPSAPEVSNSSLDSVFDNLTSSGNSSLMSGTGGDASLPTSPAEEYWKHYVFNETTGIHDVGEVRWHLCLCLLLAWIVVYLCIMKGIKTSGKAVYFTAIFPYIILVSLFFRGVTLPGAAEGIKFYLKPDFKVMKHAQVWRDAAVQILYSLGAGSGGLMAMASYNKFDNNFYRDAIIVSIINCSTSIFAGFVIFSVLGFMAHSTGVSVDHVAQDGAGLAFIVYPEAISRMFGAPMWSLAFFFMLFTLGLGSQFPTIECISTAVVDEFPHLRKYKSYLAAVICSVMFLLGLPCVTQGGMFVVQLIDTFATSFPLLIITLLECVIVSLIYGYKRFSDDIALMLGHTPSWHWLLCWIVITPIISFFILILNCVEYDGIKILNYTYPGWAEAVGWLLVILALVHIPAWMLYKVAKTVGDWQTLRWAVFGPSAVRKLHLGELVHPTEAWGPRLQENRTQQAVTAGNRPFTDIEGEHIIEEMEDPTSPNSYSYI